MGAEQFLTVCMLHPVPCFKGTQAATPCLHATRCACWLGCLFRSTSMVYLSLWASPTIRLPVAEPQNMPKQALVRQYKRTHLALVLDCTLLQSCQQHPCCTLQPARQAQQWHAPPATLAEPAEHRSRTWLQVLRWSARSAVCAHRRCRVPCMRAERPLLEESLPSSGSARA